MPQVGLEAEWRPGGGPFAVTLGALGFPAIGSVTPGIAVEQVSAHYQFVRERHWDLDGFVGLAFEQFDYKDNQRVSNHLVADFGPLVIAGVEFRF